MESIYSIQSETEMPDNRLFAQAQKGAGGASTGGFPAERNTLSRFPDNLSGSLSVKNWGNKLVITIV